MIQLIKKIIHLVFIFLLVTGYTYLSADIRPQALKAKENSGNDPSVQVEFSFCLNRNNEITGILQWSSTRSGWNKRAVNGNKKENTIILHDENFLENKPNRGWVFCLIDEYRFSLSKNKMQGDYISNACRDKGRFSLSKQN
jgi:hypothetical protein